MTHSTPRGRPRLVGRHRLVAKLAVVVAAVGIGAAVLWLRQTPEALLRVDSFAGAALQVAFWAAPGLFLYLLLARNPAAIVAEGGALIALLAWSWWSSATERHSTASLGPAMTGWFLAPSIVLAGVVFQQARRRRRETRP